MPARDERPDTSESDDLVADELRAAASKHPDNKWEARADAAAAGEPVDTPATSPVRDAVAAKSRAREAIAAKAAADPTQPSTTMTVVVSILSYVVGVVAGWGVGSWLDGDPWPIAFAGVAGGVIGFVIGRALLRGMYALRG